MATQIEYLHCSMGGSYWIPCEIVEDDGEEYVVRYYDSIVEEDVETVVTDRTMVREVAINITDEQVVAAYDEMMEVLNKHFPQVPEHQLEFAKERTLFFLRLALR